MSFPNTSKRIGKLFWKDKQKRIDFFNKIGTSLGIENHEDWYNVKKSDFRKFKGGLSLLNNYYNQSINQALKDCFPHQKWKHKSYFKHENWRIHSLKYKGNIELLEEYQFLCECGSHLGIKTHNHWYLINTNDFRLLSNFISGANLFVNHYRDSILLPLSTIFPNFIWQPWFFKRTQKHFWNNSSNIRDYIIWLVLHLEGNKGQQQEIGEEEHKTKNSINQIVGFATNLTHQTISQNYGAGLITIVSSRLKRKSNLMTSNDKEMNIIKSVLLSAFESHKTQIEQSFKQQGYMKKKGQNMLLKYIEQIFGSNENIQTEYLHPNLLFKNSNKKMEFDIFLPNKKIAFEYQGESHFNSDSTENNMFGPSKKQIQRDIEKREGCLSNSIKLIEIPFTWDQKKSSLKKLLISCETLLNK